jgi:hypothetical protein
MKVEMSQRVILMKQKNYSKKLKQLFIKLFNQNIKNTNNEMGL